MPRPKRPWFRFYVEATRDRKLRCRPPAERWLWVSVLAVARESYVPGTLLIGGRIADNDDLADEAALKVREVAKGVAYFLSEEAAMLTRNAQGALVVVNWNARQFDSDDVAARTAKSRSKHKGRNVPTSSVGTPPESESKSDVKEPPNPQPSLGGSDAPQPRKGTRAAGDNPRSIAADAEDEGKRIQRVAAAQSFGAARAQLGIERGDMPQIVARTWPDDPDTQTIALAAYESEWERRAS